MSTVGAASPGTDPGLRARKKRATRRALRLAALRLVAERGLDHVTNDEIAAEAGVSARTFFNYFASKEDALVGNDPELPGVLAEALLARPADEAPLDALAAVLVDYASQTELDPDFWRLRVQVLRAHPSLVTASAGQSAALEEQLTLAVARRAGLDPDDDPYPRLVVTVAVAVSRTVFRHAASHGLLTGFGALAAAGFDAVRAGLPAPPGRPVRGGRATP